MAKSSQISAEYLSLIEDWACAAYALVDQLPEKYKAKPTTVSQMISVLFDNKIKKETRDGIKTQGTLFDHHGEIIRALNETATSLKQHAPKIAFVFEKLSESYVAAMSNSDTFIVPDKYLGLDLAKPVLPTRKKRDPNMKLPQTILDEWRDAAIVQMEVAGVDVTQDLKTALDENFLVVRANFGNMTQKEFDHEDNEPAIRELLTKITGEPHVTVAQYMRMAI